MCFRLGFLELVRDEPDCIMVHSASKKYISHGPKPRISEVIRFALWGRSCDEKQSQFAIFLRVIVHKIPTEIVCVVAGRPSPL